MMRKVDDLGPPPHLVPEEPGGLAEDPRGRLLVDVPVLEEGLDEGRVVREMGQDPELDLRVVGRKKRRALLRDEGPPEALAELPAGRDILEVGVARGKPSRRGDRLVVGGVDPARLGVDELGQGVGVGGLQLGRLPVFEDVPGPAGGGARAPGGRRWRSRSLWSTFVFFVAGRLSLLKRISASCCGELMLNSVPASLVDGLLQAAEVRPEPVREVLEGLACRP